jgi:hypothetical protein
VRALVRNRSGAVVCIRLMSARGGGEQILATLSIITNSLLVGVTSYGLYFYFPDMSIVESLWYVHAHTALHLRPVLTKPRD